MGGYFPHLNDTAFPNIETVNAYKYQNKFDYSRYNDVQMVIHMCNVPWDMGEAHVGQRTVEGIGNVVKFENDAARDAWFDAIPASEKYTFETKFRKLHADDVMHLPIPFDVAARFNYVYVDYRLLPGDDGEPLQYENENGLRKWFYFIRSIESDAPNTTTLNIKRDTWQTFINHVKFKQVFVERGHCAMTADDNKSLLSVDELLSNPLEKSGKLLAPDLNFGNPVKVASSTPAVLNDGDMYACIATSAWPNADWGTKAANTWTVPASSSYTRQGVPTVAVIALPPSSLADFLAAVDNQAPQFKQTVLGIFFVPARLVTINLTFNFCGHKVYTLRASQTPISILDVKKEKFGFDGKYADLAKLYCSPYSHIELVRDDGTSAIINVEDTSGKLTMQTTLSLAYPWLNIDSFITGVGSGSAQSVSFRNVSEHTFNFGGRWYELAKTWQVPMFAIYQKASTNNDYATHYDRVQRKVEYDTAYTNADNSASNITANNAVTVAAATSQTANTVAANTTGVGYSNEKMISDTRYDIGITNVAYASEQATLAVTSANNNAQAAASAVNVAAGAIGSAMSGNIAGAVLGGISGAVSTGVNWQTSNASINVALSNSKATYDQGVTSANGKSQGAQDFNTRSTSLNNSTMTANTAVNNNAATSVASNNASLTRTNAGNQRSAATSAVSNSVKQAGINAPLEFGNYQNGDTAVTRPMGVFANVVTQSNSAIRQAGDQFLRFGYYLNQAWELTDFNIMPKFTYWKCTDMWVKGLDVPDMYMDEIRFFLLGGVTVWRNPADIGRVSIYENF